MSHVTKMSFAFNSLILLKDSNLTENAHAGAKLNI